MWKRREMLGVLGTGAAGLALLTNRSEAAAGQAPASGDAHANHDPRHAEMLKECDEACGHCEAACNAAFHHCISQAAAGKSEHAKMAQLVIDCAAFCTLSATMISRHSSLMIESCRALRRGLPPLRRGVRLRPGGRDDEILRRRLQALRGKLPEDGQCHGWRASSREMTDLDARRGFPTPREAWIYQTRPTSKDSRI